MTSYCSLYHQIFTTKRLAKKFVQDHDFLSSTTLDSIEPKLRIRAIRPIIGFVLAMLGTYMSILKKCCFRNDDEKWSLLIYSRTVLTKYGEKTLEEASYRLKALKQDLKQINYPWEILSEFQRFIEICSTCYAIESYELIQGGLPTLVCKLQFEILIPRIFKELSISMD